MSLKQRGMTLSELMVGIGIMGIISLIMFGLFVLATNQFRALTAKSETDELGARLEYTFRSIFSQAMDVRFGTEPNGAPVDTVPATAYPALGDRGQIASTALVAGDNNAARLTFDSLASAPLNWYVLAAFLRETGLASAPAPERGTARKTAVFYRPPSGVARTSGVIFVDFGPAPGAAGGLSPSYADEFFDRVVLFLMTKHKHSLHNVVTSVDFRVHFRYYLRVDSGNPFSWCPAVNVNAGPATCATTLPWTDVEKQFSVALRNNLLRSSTNTNIASAPGQFEERVMGATYFFFPTIPTDVR